MDLRKAGLKVTPGEIAAARGKVDKTTLAALEFAHDRILAHHQRQLPKDDLYRDSAGRRAGTRWTAIDSVGLYVPGGTASYPSSVLMNAVPAKVAGVPRIVMVVPAPKGALNPLVLVAAELAGVDEIYRVGGAQAIAALAYGTESIAPVVKIVGPGNAYVAAAKRQVFGQVGIDMVAGPSEVVVIADSDNDPAWIAADLLAQAEHDAAAQSILITDDADFAARGRGGRRGRSLRRCRARDDRARELARFRRDDPGADPRRGAGARRPPRARASGDRHGATPTRLPTRSAMPARSSSAAIRPR